MSLRASDSMENFKQEEKGDFNSGILDRQLGKKIAAVVKARHEQGIEGACEERADFVCCVFCFSSHPAL